MHTHRCFLRLSLACLALAPQVWAFTAQAEPPPEATFTARPTATQTGPAARTLNASALARLAQQHRDRGQWQAALALYREGKHRYPDDPHFAAREIMTLADAGEIDQALAAAETALEKQPRSTDLNLAQAYAFQRAAKPYSALLPLDRAMALEPRIDYVKRAWVLGLQQAGVNGMDGNAANAGKMVLGDDQARHLQAYRQAGLSINPAHLPKDEATRTLWAQFKNRALVDLTRELAAKIQAIRGPQVQTARNLYARPVLEPASQAWFAQSLDSFLEGYDWTALMAMPRMEHVAPDQEEAWLKQLVARAGEHPNGLQRTIFQVQARDWRSAHDNRNPTDPLIHSSVIAGWLTTLQRRGALNLGYYPDDFVRNHPDPALLRPALSNGWFPFVP